MYSVLGLTLNKYDAKANGLLVGTIAHLPTRLGLPFVLQISKSPFFNSSERNSSSVILSVYFEGFPMNKESNSFNLKTG